MLTKYQTSSALHSQISASKIPFQITGSQHHSPQHVIKRSHLAHLQSRCENNAASVCSLCESSVLGIDPVGWPWLSWPWLWITAQDGCRNDWEEPQSSECGRMYVCVCVCVIIQHGRLSARDLVSYSERALCVWVWVSALFRAPWESAELYSRCWHTGCVTTSNLVIVGHGGHGVWITEWKGEREMEKKEKEGAEEWGFTVVDAGRGEKEIKNIQRATEEKSNVGKKCNEQNNRKRWRNLNHRNTIEMRVKWTGG